MNVQSAGAAARTVQTTSSPLQGKRAEESFLDYMKESPAERMIDRWLTSHHLTKEALAAMPQAQRDALEQQMKDDIEQQIKRAAEDKAGRVLI